MLLSLPLQVLVLLREHTIHPLISNVKRFLKNKFEHLFVSRTAKKEDFLVCFIGGVQSNLHRPTIAWPKPVLGSPTLCYTPSKNVA